MYNFNLLKNEKIIKVFEEIYIIQEENEKVTTIALTNKRLLFLDYLNENEGQEVLRIARGTNYLKIKDVYYYINLNDIKSITKEEYYQIILKNNQSFKFDDEELYNLLKK